MSTEDSTNIPYGYCQCGCGEKTRIAAKTSRNAGQFKGVPLHFVHGHNFRDSNPTYTKEDRGYHTPCWIWQGAVSVYGYGRWPGVGERMAHRVYYKEAKGEIPKGTELDHLCAPFGGPRNCVNPDHLEVVTHTENMRRGRATKLTFDEVVKIREMYVSSGLTKKAIGQLFGVGEGQAGRIIRGEAWRD